MTSWLHSARLRRLVVPLLLLSAVSSVFFAMRSYGSFLALQSAITIGKPELSSLRAWMTLDYVATGYRAPLPQLLKSLDLPPDTPPDESLKTIADRRGLSRVEFVRQVQRAVSESMPHAPADDEDAKEADGWTDRALSALLAYGYPALAAILLFGALGLPVPTGLATVLAGSLVALGHLQWAWASAIVVAASIGGDALGYVAGRVVSENFLARHGRWVGYTPPRKAAVQNLFCRWGAMTVLLSRTLVSHLSSVVSLLAGATHYQIASFIIFAFVGRLMWTSAYLGLGYGIGSNLDAANDFMKNLTGLLLSLAVLLTLGAYRAGLFASPTRPA
ncbi:MAG: DedA family protein [Xanthobacteraceae bacterium]